MAKTRPPESNRWVVLAIPSDELRQSNRDRSFGFKAQIALCRLDVSIRLCHVAGLHRKHLFYCPAAKHVFENSDEIEQRFGPIVANIVKPVLARFRPGGTSGGKDR